MLDENVHECIMKTEYSNDKPIFFYFQTHLDDCKAAKVNCVRLNCNLNLTRDTFKQHYDNQCIWREVNCCYCQKEIIFCKHKVCSFSFFICLAVLNTLSRYCLSFLWCRLESETCLWHYQCIFCVCTRRTCFLELSTQIRSQ